MRRLAVIPAYNEAGTVAGVVSALRDGVEGDVLVIDDGSSDRTGQLARSAGATVVRFPTNLGIGAAIRAGLIVARDHRYDIAYQFDADGQHDVASVPPLLLPIAEGRADLVIGSRFLDGEYPVPPPRRAAMRLVRRVVRKTTGLSLSDPSSGFRAFSPRALAVLADIYPTDYMDSVEAITIAHAVGLRITEIPVKMYERAHGASSASFVQGAWHTTRAVFAVYARHRVAGSASPETRKD